MAKSRKRAGTESQAPMQFWFGMQIWQFLTFFPQFSWLQHYVVGYILKSDYRNKSTHDAWRSAGSTLRTKHVLGNTIEFWKMGANLKATFERYMICIRGQFHNIWLNSRHKILKIFLFKTASYLRKSDTVRLTRFCWILSSYPAFLVEISKRIGNSPKNHKCKSRRSKICTILYNL